MPDLLVASLLALTAGASIVVQGVLNAHLRGALGSAAWSGLANYAVGLACMGLLALSLREGPPALATVARLPWWAWCGGAFGAVFIGLSILLVPRLGAAPFIALLVAGQMLASVAVDHLGWMGMPRHPLDTPRLLGILLLVGGVVLIRR